MSTAKWVHFIRKCLLHRTHADDFRDLAGLMNEKYLIEGKSLIQIIIECRQSYTVSSDPLIPQYIRAAVTSGLSQTSDVLSVLISNWNKSSPGQGLPAEVKEPGCLSSPDALIINDLALIVASNKSLSSASGTRRSLLYASRWLVALIGWISEDGGNRSYLAILTLLEALGILFSSIISTQQGMLLLASQEDADLKYFVTDALETALPYLNSLSVQLHSRLEMIQKHFNLFRSEAVKDGNHLVQSSQPMPDALQFEANIVEGPTVRTRASLFIYLHAAVSPSACLSQEVLRLTIKAPRSTQGERRLLDRFSERAGDHVSMFIDIIVAVFDVLSNSQARKEGEQAITIYRSFLMNKMPPILNLISSSSLEPIQAAFCISQALGRIDLGAIPLSAYDMERRSSLAGLRQEFLFACVLHRLIPEASVETILGEKPMQALPSHGLYEKDQLVQQITGSPQKGEQLIKEIELMEGNAGAVAAAIVEAIHSHCRNKDTVQLKDLCNLIVRKPHVMDIITLFKTPSFILNPLCSLLDDWNWDDLHSESQLVYEEFGAVLLLVLSFTNRYELVPFEIGITSTTTTFVQQLLEMEANDETLDDLDGAKTKLLGDWIAALFVADPPSDELTSSCSPREFYKLVPTLFSQSLDACANGKLSIEGLKSGFDFLLEPFLLPSLLIGLQCLASHLWQKRTEGKIVLSLLQSLIKPPSGREAREIHQSILSMVAENLLLQLRAIGDEEPHKRLASSIADTVSRYAPSKRNIGWTSEILPTSSTPRGILPSICQMFHSLLSWSTGIETSTSPPKFTSKILSAAILLFGAARVLSVLLDELRSLLGTNKIDAGIDIVCTIICAPLTGSHRPTSCLSLRDSLKISHTDMAKGLKNGDTALAEVVARVYHRVEAFPSAHSQQEMGIDPSAAMGQDLTNMDLQNINLDDAAAENAEMEVGTLGIQPAAEDIDQILDGATAMDSFGNNSMGSGVDDVFGLDGDDLLNFDNMDLEGMF